MSNTAICIRSLRFGYDAQLPPIFTELDLDISTGKRFGLFGPNGAGKTTLINCMTGLLQPQAGTVELMGQQLRAHDTAIRSVFGFVPQDFSFYHELSPLENLAFFGAWYGMQPKKIRERSKELLEVLGLSDVANRQVGQFSGGMKRRVNLAIGVLHEPAILFLDEPTVGVDVQTRHAMMGYLKQLNAAGTTLLYTSHQLKEAEQLCNEMALFDHGRIIARGTLEQLMAENGASDLEALFIQLTGHDYRDG